MSVAYFYQPDITPGTEFISLDEANARHAVQVLRMKEGSPVVLTDGKGIIRHATILLITKKTCDLRIDSQHSVSPDAPAVSIGLSLLKNTGRFEWFLEKATELGIAVIYPLLCERTEKQQFRAQRMQGILESALVQSQQAWIPVLQPPQKLSSLLTSAMETEKMIAFCGEGEKRPLAQAVVGNHSKLIIIGPEGDFTPAENEAAIKAKFTAVSLGDHRLRSETAAVAAASLLKLG